MSQEARKLLLLSHSGSKHGESFLKFPVNRPAFAGKGQVIPKHMNDFFVKSLQKETVMIGVIDNKYQTLWFFSSLVFSSSILV